MHFAIVDKAFFGMSILEICCSHNAVSVESYAVFFDEIVNICVVSFGKLLNKKSSFLSNKSLNKHKYFIFFLEHKL